jgi:uncharacterized membrane protein YkvA (DUF1232 family)
MTLLEDLKQRARRLKVDIYALYLAARHPETPWYAKLLVAGIVAYALSPIDLIPDFIPVLGYLDDLILIPIGIAVIWIVLAALATLWAYEAFAALPSRPRQIPALRMEIP